MGKYHPIRLWCIGHVESLNDLLQRKTGKSSKLTSYRLDVEYNDRWYYTHFFVVAIVNRNIAILGWTAEFGLTIFHIILFCYREVEQAVEDLDG